MPAIFPYQAEDLMKEEFFGHSRHGFYVDVGANHPRLGSQTWHLEQLGWDGILVEPQADLAEELRRQRRARVFAVACSSPANADKKMTLNVAGIHSSFDPNFHVPGMRPTGVALVPVRTLDDILSEAGAPVPLDFVSIDVETHEVEVLQGFDLARWRPRLILIEDLAHDLRIHRSLTSRGYKWVRRTGVNGWYVPVGTPFDVDLVGRLQFVRKHYLGVPFRRLRDSGRRLRHGWQQRRQRGAT
jgi:FkbM family methyltransferase